MRTRKEHLPRLLLQNNNRFLSLALLAFFIGFFAQVLFFHDTNV